MCTLEEVSAFLRKEFPQSHCVVDALGDRGATVHHEIGRDDLRPGATVSGPVLMAVADVALYVALLGEVGIVPLAVTTSLTINFLRKAPATGRVIGRCQLLKVGKALVVGEVYVYSSQVERILAHAVGTYSIPPAATR